MTGLLVGALVLPLAGGLAVAAVRERPWLATGTGAATAVLWAVLAAVDDVPQLGRIEVSPLAAAGVAGAAALTAAFHRGATLGRSMSLCAITVLAVAGTTGGEALPDRPLAIGLVVLGMLAALTALAGRSGPEPSWPTLVVVGPAAAVAAGLLVDDAGTAGVVVTVGAGAVLAASAVLRRAEPAVLVGVLLAVARTAPLAHGAAGDGRAEQVALAAVVAALATAVALVVRRRHAVRAPHATGTELPLLVLVAAAVLLTQDLEGLRAAGALLAGGGVLALAAGHPVGLVAAIPGVAAAVEASGSADQPVNGAAGAVVVVLILAAGRPAWTSPVGPGVVAAVAFAVVPLWGWAGAPTSGHRPAAGVAAAAVAVVVAAAVVIRAATLPTGPGRVVGRLRRRSHAANHASTHTPALEDGPIHGQDEPVPEATAARQAPGPPEHPVAPPPRAVPRRPRGGGVGGGGRLRARPGRPPA